MKQIITIVCLSSWFATAVVMAQGAEQPEDPAHDELRALRDGALDAFKKKDIDKLLTYLHDDVVITFQNAELCRGHEAVRDFHKRMSEGDDRKVESLESDFKVDELATLYGDDTAVSSGSIDDEFELAGGMDFSLASRWTATMVKEDDRWTLAAFHVSTNMFDNGVSDMMLKWNTIKYGGIALAIGIALGMVGARLFGKSRKREA